MHNVHNIDHTYVMYLAVPLVHADRIQTGIQSIIYINGKDFSFVYPFGHLQTYTYYLKAFSLEIHNCSLKVERSCYHFLLQEWFYVRVFYTFD